MDVFSRDKVFITKHIQYYDSGMSFLRIEWLANQGWSDPKALSRAISDALEGVDAEFSIRLGSNRYNIGLFCSAQTHVISELLNRSCTSLAPSVNVSFVVSDNEQVRKMADQFGVPFFYVSPTQPAQAIQLKQLEIIRRYKPDYLGLAHYDALLSQSLIEQAGCPVITVHNSFLPTVKSKKAYSLAYEQGHKLIGATARLVQSKALGPIIEQDMVKLGPGLAEKDINLLGQSIERKVFVTALRKLVEHKVMVYNAKTIVFD